MTLHLRYAARSDVGIVRKDNEDSGFAGRTLLAVADGMGGHAAGELASSTAVATLAELDSEELQGDEVLSALDDAIVTSAERIAQFVQADPSRAGMGTTVTAIAWRGGRIAVVHVGDSRAYVLRDGELSQITRDHTYVQSLVDVGRLTPEQARHHPKRNLMLRAIDGNQVPERDLSVREARVGDRYLLCSDGLCGVVEDAAIARVLRTVADPTAAVTALVDLALEAGAPDNVTAVVADVVETDDEAVLDATVGIPVVVGAAGEKRNRAALPGLHFPDDVGLDSESTDPDAPIVGPAVAGGLVARGSGSPRPTSSAEPPGRSDTPSEPGDEASGPGAETGGAPDGPVAGQAGPRGAEQPGPAVGEGAQDSRLGAAESWATRHWRGLAGVVIAVLSVAVGVAGFCWWLSSQWFVGVEAGYVAVYQGVPQSVLGVELNRVSARTALQVDRLPLYDQAQLEGTIDSPTRAQADRIVDDLAARAAECASDSPPLGCPPPEGDTPADDVEALTVEGATL